MGIDYFVGNCTCVGVHMCRLDALAGFRSRRCRAKTLQSENEPVIGQMRILRFRFRFRPPVTPSICPAQFCKKKLIRFSRRVFAQLAKKMVFGDLASKEPKDSNPARQQCTGRLGSCSAVKKTALARRVALFCLFFETLLSTKGVCRKTVGATCAAGSSARRSHRIFACVCQNRMNTASKLGPHTQTDRGTCPGVGL